MTSSGGGGGNSQPLGHGNNHFHGLRSYGVAADHQQLRERREQVTAHVDASFFMLSGYCVIEKQGQIKGGQIGKACSHKPPGSSGRPVLRFSPSPLNHAAVMYARGRFIVNT